MGDSANGELGSQKAGVLYGLAAYGIQPADLPAISSAALQASSMKPNPVRLQQSQLIELLHQAL